CARYFNYEDDYGYSNTGGTDAFDFW
nr:immunoglobulin heavy chain junction region [Macaca mulatta]MOX63998.1 immunoglobulin heavy chain junction region [Macaca mulatta]MOX64799.1 immunoglobulin heavy chain junction region [Macaca mulatta]MOX67396.1 immunoglobulin heavy chain junction region [Macaca mulatta]MOX68152.1 immunoglobulin heavy chain junction region [Macaca mulatta]